MDSWMDLLGISTIKKSTKMTLKQKYSFLLIAVFFFASCNEKDNSDYLRWDVFGADGKKCESVNVFFKGSTLYLADENYLSLNAHVNFPLLDTAKKVMFVSRHDLEKTIHNPADSSVLDALLSDYASISSKSGKNSYSLSITFMNEASVKDSLFMKNYVHAGKNPFTELWYEIDFSNQRIHYLQKKIGHEIFEWNTSFKKINCL